MSQLKFYKYAVVVLLILNVAMLAFFVFTKPKPGHRPPPRNDFKMEAIRMLELNKDQIEQFHQLIDDHNFNIQSIDKQQSELLVPYFASLSDTSIQIDEDALLNRFQKSEKEKILQTRLHFQKIKAMLNESQMDNFEVFIDDFLGALFSRR